MYKLIFKPFAEEDAEDATNWYNEESVGLGDEFLLALEAALNSILRTPENYQIIYKGLSRALTVRFPYGIFFTIEDDKIYLQAIVHTSRSPKIWKIRK